MSDETGVSVQHARRPRSEIAQLDAKQVKHYAAHFCGTQELRQASRERVEAFINHLTELASQGRQELVERLALYASRHDSTHATDSEAA